VVSPRKIAFGCVANTKIEKHLSSSLRRLPGGRFESYLGQELVEQVVIILRFILHLRLLCRGLDDPRLFRILRVIQ
jgi:hypothetical protein